MSSSSHSQRENNQLLATLSSDNWRHMEPHLEWVEMPAGSILHEAGFSLRHVYFPVTAVVSLVSTMLDGATVEVAVVGSEGMVGVDAFMGSSNANNGTPANGTLMAQNSAMVVRGGHGYRMKAQAIAQHARQSEQVMHQLLNYARTLFLQIAQTSACNRHHSIDQQLARWMMAHLERQPDNELHITQERIASLLGVRREGVTGGTLRLQKAGVIRNGRGQISVLDRAGLQARACECHSVIRSAYEQLKNDAMPQGQPVQGIDFDQAVQARSPARAGTPSGADSSMH